MTSLRHGRLGLAAATAFIPAVLLGASEPGRLLAEGDFLQLLSIGVPAAGVLVLVTVMAFLSSRLGSSQRRLYGTLLVATGSVVAFQGARVLSTFWLLWGRNLALEPGFLTYCGGALLWLVGGLITLIEGSRTMAPGKDAGRATTLAAGLGLVSVPALPWVMLTGDGQAGLIFNDLTDATFSAFPIQTELQVAMWAVAAGLAWTATASRLTAGWSAAHAWRLGSIAGGLLGTLVAHGFLAVEILALRDALRVGQLWPGPNVGPLLACLVAGWCLTREGPGDRDHRPVEDEPFQVQRT